MKTIYLARPMAGLTNREAYDYFIHTRMDIRNSEYDVLIPIGDKNMIRDETKIKAEGYDNPRITNHAIYERCMWMVRNSDIVLANFLGVDSISIGTCMELAVASQLGKHTIVVMEKDNVHRHAFVLEAADVVFEMISHAKDYLHNL